MNTINLNAIIKKHIEGKPHYTRTMIARVVTREVAHQVLVLASENAKLIQGITGAGLVKWSLDRQSILGVLEMIKT